jgi:hypothetical protein
MSWTQLSNGPLLRAAEAEFDALMTTDQNILHQQNLSGNRLAILILPTTNWPKIRLNRTLVADAVDNLRSGDVVELKFP